MPLSVLPVFVHYPLRLTNSLVGTTEYLSFRIWGFYRSIRPNLINPHANEMAAIPS
jgi:hypothetical protein